MQLLSANGVVRGKRDGDGYRFSNSLCKAAGAIYVNFSGDPSVLADWICADGFRPAHIPSARGIALKGGQIKAMACLQPAFPLPAAIHQGAKRAKDKAAAKGSLAAQARLVF